MNDCLVKNEILGVDITDATSIKVLEDISAFLEKSTASGYIVTPNPEILVYANSHPNFRKILNQARIAIPDGIGILLAAQILGKPLRERITGTDLLTEICKESVKLRKKNVKEIVSIGFLGGRDGVAVGTAERLLKDYPELSIGLVSENWSGNELRTISGNSVQQFLTREMLVGAERVSIEKHGWWNGKQIDILFVAYGFPKQEEWMAEHVGKLPFRLAMGVGGAFDFISGRVPRAPRWIQAGGMEWLYRLLRQPWRWKRQLALLSFVWLVIKARFGFSSKS